MGSGYGFEKRGLLLRVRLIPEGMLGPEVEEAGRGVCKGGRECVFSCGRILIEACLVWVCGYDCRSIWGVFEELIW